MIELRGLPSELEAYRDTILSTRMSYLDIDLLPSLHLLPWQSKVGGHPYLLSGQNYPLNEQGEPLFFLAQINFKEFPRLSGYPENGLLQFFINDDRSFGAKVPNGFQVRYHPQVYTDANYVQDVKWPLRVFGPDLPFDPLASWAMRAERKEELVAPLDYRFEEKLGEDFLDQFPGKRDELWDYFFELADNSGHKVGGYAHFVQQDIREEPMDLLFQLDSDARHDIRWGDMGIAHFFIRPADLQSRDFSRILYSWDAT